jgi:hypothetical protein
MGLIKYNLYFKKLQKKAKKVRKLKRVKKVQYLKILLNMEYLSVQLMIKAIQVDEVFSYPSKIHFMRDSSKTVKKLALVDQSLFKANFHR